MAARDKMVSIGLAPELMERIDTFRFDNRFATRVEAIRWLIQSALDEKLKPGKANIAITKTEL